MDQDQRPARQRSKLTDWTGLRDGASALSSSPADVPDVGVDFGGLSEGVGLFDPLLTDPFVAGSGPWSLFGTPSTSAGTAPGGVPSSVSAGTLLGVVDGPAVPPLAAGPRFPHLFPPMAAGSSVASTSSAGAGPSAASLAVPGGVPTVPPALADPSVVGVPLAMDAPYNFFAPFPAFPSSGDPGFAPLPPGHGLAHPHGLHGHGHGHGHPFGSMGGGDSMGGLPASYGFTATAREFVPVAFSGLPGSSQQGGGPDQGALDGSQ